MCTYLALDPNVRRQLCINSGGVSEPTLRRYLDGATSLRPSSRGRIETALRANGLAHLIRPTVAVALTSTPDVR